MFINLKKCQNLALKLKKWQFKCHNNEIGPWVAQFFSFFSIFRNYSIFTLQMGSEQFQFVQGLF